MASWLPSCWVLTECLERVGELPVEIELGIALDGRRFDVGGRGGHGGGLVETIVVNLLLVVRRHGASERWGKRMAQCGEKESESGWAKLKGSYRTEEPYGHEL